MDIAVVTLIMFVSMLILLALGLPLAFALGGVGMLFVILLWGDLGGTTMLAIRAFGAMQTIILIAIPCFIFMANMLERSGIADDLYHMMYTWMGPLRGGLAMGTVLICTLFAAMAGISGAATVTMGLISIPSMLGRKYDKNIALGCVAAGGALGVLIPPSVIMIVYAFMVSESVGRMFAGGVFPGLVLSSLFCIYIGIRCFLQPKLGPSIPVEERATWREKFVSLRAVILPIAMVFMVLGSIFAGIATPTEASAVGAFGSVLCALIYRRFNWRTFKEASFRSFRITGMIMWIFLGATAFAVTYHAIGAPELIKELIIGLELNRWMVLIGIQFTFFILGMFLDPLGILMITIPVYFPLMRELQFDILWFGILYVVNMEMAYLTPPFGVNLFYLKGIVPKGVSMADIYHSIVPFVALQAIGLVLVMVFPQLAVWLPNLWLGKRG